MINSLKCSGQYLFLALCLVSASNAFGQSLLPNGNVISANAGSWAHHFGTMRESQPMGPLGMMDSTIRYFNPALPSVDLGSPEQIGPYLVATYGERITTSGGGFLDSVQITLDSITTDSILVYMLPDTLFVTSAGTYHLMNIFDPNAQSIDLGYIHANQVHGRTTVTFSTPHVPVPVQNFWVAVEPNLDPVQNSFTNGFLLVGDSENVQPRTADNSHSGFLAAYNGSVLSAVLDSTFLYSSGQPIYTNFDITAFISTSPSAVSAQNTTPNQILIFPNPASSSIQIQGEAPISSVDLLDLLGRTVLSTKLAENQPLDVSRLEPGRYEAIVHTSAGIQSEPILIQH